MHRGVLLLVTIVAAVPSCTAPPSAEPYRPFGPSEMYARRRHRPTPPPAVVRRQDRPRRRDLTATPPQRTWYPRSTKLNGRWTTIVIHHSATKTGSARTFDKYHREQKGWDELGYHFVIGNGTETPDGYVEAGPRWHTQKHGAHCKTPSNYYNDHGIGICLVGDFTKRRPTGRQLNALKELVAFLSRSCSIPASRVTTHGHINKKTKCPGRFFALGPVHRHLSRRTEDAAVARPTLASRSNRSSSQRIRHENRNLLSEQLNRSPFRSDGYNKPITYRTSVR